MSRDVAADDTSTVQENNAYKTKKIEEASSFYDQTIFANVGEILYHYDKAAVYMEMG